MYDKQGYVLVRANRHPLAHPNGYVREHILVLSAEYGDEFLAGKIVHHINGDKTDNRLENLQVTSRGEHNSIHNKERGRDSMGRFLPRLGRTHDDLPWRNAGIAP